MSSFAITSIRDAIAVVPARDSDEVGSLFVVMVVILVLVGGGDYVDAQVGAGLRIVPAFFYNVLRHEPPEGCEANASVGERSVGECFALCNLTADRLYPDPRVGPIASLERVCVHFLCFPRVFLVAVLFFVLPYVREVDC